MCVLYVLYLKVHFGINQWNFIAEYTLKLFHISNGNASPIFLICKPFKGVGFQRKLDAVLDTEILST